MRKVFLLISYAVLSVLLVSLLKFLLFIPPSEFLKELSDPEVSFAVKLSLVTGFISTAVVMLFSLPVAYALARYSFPLRRVLSLLLDLPIAFPEILVGLLLLTLFSGFPQRLLNLLGLEINFSPLGVVIAQIAVAFPYTVKILFTALERLDPRYEQVARSLGYTPFETFLKVVIPMLKGALVAAATVAFARAFGAFGAVLIFAGGVRMKTETLPIGVFLNLSYGDLNKAIAMGGILIAVAFLTIVVVELLSPKENPD